MQTGADQEKLLTSLDYQTRLINVLGKVSTEINSSLDLQHISNATFQLLDSFFDFKHLMILLADDPQENLTVYASHGYADQGTGAAVPFGKGLIGMVAKNKKLAKMSNMAMQTAFARQMAMKQEQETGKKQATVELPGIPNCASQLAIPLTIDNDVVGVLAVESEAANTFLKADEELLTMIGVQIAIAIQNARQYDQIESTNAQLKDLNENLENKVEERTRELAEQKAIVERRNKEVTDSIRYALRFQQALLPSEGGFEKVFEEHFVIYKPKDIVSGDFYWLVRQNHQVYFSAIDCTGHGVPGAFVSLMGGVGLRRAVVELGLRYTNEILDSLNEFIERYFNRTGNIKDGMDLAFCCVNYASETLEFSGANNPAYVVRNGELIELAPDKQPIGDFMDRKPFGKESFPLQDGDKVFLTSDGYIDQFGGPKGKKFMKGRFKDLLVKHASLPLAEMSQQLDSTILDWMGDTDQLDDICVMGIKYSRTMRETILAQQQEV